MGGEPEPRIDFQLASTLSLPVICVMINVSKNQKVNLKLSMVRTKAQGPFRKVAGTEVVAGGSPAASRRV